MTGMTLFKWMLDSKMKNDIPLVYIMHLMELADFSRDNLDARLLRYPGMKKDFSSRYYFLERVVAMLNKNYTLMPLDKLVAQLTSKKVE